MHDRISVNSICFPGASLADLSRYWGKLGAGRVSFVSSQLPEDDLGTVQSLLAVGGHRVETITHVFADTLVAHEEGWHEARTRLSRLINTAREIGARSIYMLTGGRGAMSWEEAAAAFSAAVAPCVAEAHAAGVALAVENALPLLAHVHMAHSLRDAITLAEMAGIGVCIDIFGCWTEAGLDALIERAVPRCAVVQVSDYVLGDRSLPARAVPTDDVIPLAHILGRLLTAGYANQFDLELIGPRIDAEGRIKAVRRSADRLDEILRELLDGFQR